MNKNRLKFDFQEKRKLKLHDNFNLDILDYLEIWNSSEKYFDSDRKFGYGGYSYDSRWKRIVKILIDEFKLNKSSTLLDAGCAKGYLVNDFEDDNNVGNATGIDISLYALIKGKRDGVKGHLICSNITDMPFENKSFSLVFCKDTIHNMLNKNDCVKALKEIKRVGKNTWIRVGAYENNKQKKILDKWASFAKTYLHVNEWLEIFDKADYNGNYDWFHPSEEI